MTTPSDSNPADGPTQQTAAKGVPPGGMERAGLHPGDELPASAPNAGENVCRACGGSGRAAEGERCASCGGTGIVIESVAGGP